MDTEDPQIEQVSKDETITSPLGTQEYWDQIYQRDKGNFADHGDAGEIWFGEDSVDKMVHWVEKRVEDKSSKVLDVGCGNGHLLFALAEEGFDNLYGVDYSPSAIELCKQVAETEGHEGIQWSELDLTDVDGLREDFVASFDLILDKGTFDAITLAPKDEAAVKPTTLYQQTVAKMMKPDARFLITTCNWTQDEIIKEFEPYFKYHSHVKYPSFKFGGVQGQTISTVAFTKV